ncbi:hypothetical protein [Arcticibacter eurypsychrophilus]|uniref:hypothetical protein n=1 Tax=Arcticibacter eurypsychrophilus TaxID=1434752 RepID=UPI001FE20256|nr:hypothetical protein [Arcticibacter eurypsychrophilus]
MRANNRLDITMDFWRNNIDKIIELNDKVILNHKGSIGNAQMEKRKIQVAKEADEKDLNELEALQNKIKFKNK